jgi:hypothetical protein
MFIDPATAKILLEGSYEAFKNRKSILTLFKKLGFLARHGYLRISVFGAGGTGKTYLARLLEKGEIDPELYSKPYEESLFPEDAA